MREVRAVLSAAFPGREPASVEPHERGGRKRTFLVRFANGDDAVVVQRSTDGPALRAEVALTRAIRARTGVPAAPVAAAGSVDGASYLVTERVVGRDLHKRFVGLSPDARRRVARSLGRYLGKLHVTFRFDAVGPLRIADGVGNGDETDGTDEMGDTTDTTDTTDATHANRTDGTDGEAAADALVATGGDDWQAWLSTYSRSGLAALPAAFDSLRDDLSTLFADPDVPRSASPRLFPWDFRPGNALVAGNDGTVTAVLDWEAPLAAAAPLSAAKAEYLVADWYVPAEAEALRAAFIEGYESVRPYPDVAPVHRAAAIVNSAVDASGAVTNPGYPERDRAASIAFHRRHLEDCL